MYAQGKYFSVYVQLCIPIPSTVYEQQLINFNADTESWLKFHIKERGQEQQSNKPQKHHDPDM